MLRTAIFLGWLSLVQTAFGQGRVHMYPDDQLVWRDMVAHVDNGVVRMGHSWNGDVAFTMLHDGMWDETRIFQSRSTSSLDVAYTVRDGKLYLGDSSFSSGILYTFEDRQIFVGDSTFPLDVAYTLREETRRFGGNDDAPLWGIYKGDSRSWSDRIAVLEGAPDTAAVFALLGAAGWL